MLPLTSIQAAVFGDANSANGIEDQRQSRDQSDIWPAEFNSVGRLSCLGVLQGSAILFEAGLANGLWVPALITTKHAIEDFQAEDCSFTPENDSWRKVAVAGVLAKGGHYHDKTDGLEDSKSDADTNSSIASMYSSDWLILELNPWVSWRKYALKAESIGSLAAANRLPEMNVYMVGFNVMRHAVMVHANCQFGLSEQSQLLSGYKNLGWDNCDSTQGASGGGLFARIGKSYQLIGLRVGSLFDEVIVGTQPTMGAAFDINAHINVSRLISDEMFELVCISPKYKCELVSNNESGVDNE